MNQDYTDEAGKVIKGSNPFIQEPNQSNAVVDMKGEWRLRVTRAFGSVENA
jgi:hypothetical protein